MPINGSVPVTVEKGLFRDCILVGGTRNFAIELPKELGLMTVRAISGSTEPRAERKCLSQQCDGSLKVNPWHLEGTEEDRVYLKCNYCSGAFVWVKEEGKFFWNGSIVLPYRI